MHDNWTRDRLPFHAAAAPYPTAAFEEAVARLLFVAERQWPAAWLHSSSGCGKTAALQSVWQELRWQGRALVRLSLRGCTTADFWSLLSDGLGRPAKRGEACQPSCSARLVNCQLSLPSPGGVAA